MRFAGRGRRRRRGRGGAGSTTKPPEAESRVERAALPEIEIGSDFHHALDVIDREGRSAFVTGVAGTGKSTLLQYFREITERQVVVVAPTGIAAVNVGGQTIHSFFRFPPRLVGPDDIKPGRNRNLYRRLETLVIDEVSMVRVDVMDGIDRALRINRGNEQPFGGVQVVMFGDPYQLPPVVDDGVREYLERRYGGVYFFDAPGLKRARPLLIELRERYRHRDQHFITILDAIRNDCLEDHTLDDLNAQVREEQAPADREGYVTLTPTNVAADRINQAMLLALEGPEHEFQAKLTGQFGDRTLPTDERLRLRVGARVMTLKNDSQGRWVNGTIGEVTKLSEDAVWITTDSGEHELKRGEWEKVDYRYDAGNQRIEQKVVGTFVQYPIRLAWALTIHKAQGQTFDRTFIDFGRGTFAHGQAYVALSRCRTLEGTRLGRPVRQGDIQLDPEAVAYRDVFATED